MKLLHLLLFSLLLFEAIQEQPEDYAIYHIQEYRLVKKYRCFQYEVLPPFDGLYSQMFCFCPNPLSPVDCANDLTIAANKRRAYQQKYYPHGLEPRHEARIRMLELAQCRHFGLIEESPTWPGQTAFPPQAEYTNLINTQISDTRLLPEGGTRTLVVSPYIKHPAGTSFDQEVYAMPSIKNSIYDEHLYSFNLLETNDAECKKDEELLFVLEFLFLQKNGCIYSQNELICYPDNIAECETELNNALRRRRLMREKYNNNNYWQDPIRGDLVTNVFETRLSTGQCLMEPKPADFGTLHEQLFQTYPKTYIKGRKFIKEPATIKESTFEIYRRPTSIFEGTNLVDDSLINFAWWESEIGKKETVLKIWQWNFIKRYDCVQDEKRLACNTKANSDFNKDRDLLADQMAAADPHNPRVEYIRNAIISKIDVRIIAELEKFDFGPDVLSADSTKSTITHKHIVPDLTTLPLFGAVAGKISNDVEWA